ncbi:MAG: hypothetical protein LBG80_12040 [Bacteroidales bacterium]|jgi:hypothetical protein|nr:hypothetical protein [Bacteroidales bacterium]
MKKICILGVLSVLGIAGIVAVNLNPQNGFSDVVLANTEALSSEGGSGCHYKNGYTAFSDKAGGAYDCCQIWRNKAIDEEATTCQ